MRLPSCSAGNFHQASLGLDSAVYSVLIMFQPICISVCEVSCDNPLGRQIAAAILLAEQPGLQLLLLLLLLLLMLVCTFAGQAGQVSCSWDAAALADSDRVPRPGAGRSSQTAAAAGARSCRGFPGCLPTPSNKCRDKVCNHMLPY